MRTLRKLVLGETWSLPLGVAALLLAGAGLQWAAPAFFHHAGGPLLAAGVAAVLWLAVARGARPR